jgi:hypothetical protein
MIEGSIIKLEDFKNLGVEITIWVYYPVGYDEEARKLREEIKNLKLGTVWFTQKEEEVKK